MGRPALRPCAPCGQRLDRPRPRLVPDGRSDTCRRGCPAQHAPAPLLPSCAAAIAARARGLGALFPLILLQQLLHIFGSCFYWLQQVEHYQFLLNQVPLPTTCTDFEMVAKTLHDVKLTKLQGACRILDVFCCPPMLSSYFLTPQKHLLGSPCTSRPPDASWCKEYCREALPNWPVFGCVDTCT